MQLVRMSARTSCANCTDIAGFLMEKWSTEKVSDFLQENAFDEEVVEIFRQNKVSGRVLVLLNDEEMHYLGIAAFGDRHYLSHLIAKERSSNTTCSGVRLYNYLNCICYVRAFFLVKDSKNDPRSYSYNNYLVST